MTGPAVLLFSYGTLRQGEVQERLFGRVVETRPDALAGFVLGEVAIADPAVVALSGRAAHPVLRPSGDPADEVHGAVLALTEAELAAADAYEDPAYARVAVRTRAGRDAFAYVLAADLA